jgi:hypothetical protein
VNPDVKPQAKAVGDTHSGCVGGREGGRGVDPGVGGLLGDLNLEGIDAAQMDDLGGATDEIVAAQMEILAENLVSDNGEDTVELLPSLVES